MGGYLRTGDDLKKLENSSSRREVHMYVPLKVGLGRSVGLRDFCHILTLLPPGASVFHKHMSS